MSDNELLARVLPYVPPYWVRQALVDPYHTLVGREDRIHAAVLFVDISGFTPMSEALSKRGREGVEELSSILDRYFETMSDLVVESGGEVVKFAGDSLLVLFPVQAEHGDAHLGAAIHCSLLMQKAMADFGQVYTSAGTFPLRMKIGMSEGTVYTTTIGDEERGMQPVFAGRPLTRCMQAEDVAGAGEIVVDAALVGRTPGRLDIGEPRGTFRVITEASDVPVLPPMEHLDVSHLEPRQVAALVDRLAPYLPPQFMERVYLGQRGILNEHRPVTIMFAKFGGLDYDRDPSVGRVLQAYFGTMQDCISRYGGRLNEVDIIADGGTLVVFFGAPTAHEDDELRAVSCAWDMQQAVMDVCAAAEVAVGPIRQSIGISTGNVFAGEVGAPVRRTYTVVGDEVNLASRLMNLAQWGEVLVTSWVQKRSAARFDLRAMGEVNVRGKAEPLLLFALTARREDRAHDALLSRLADRHPAIGRSAELAELKRVVDRAWQGVPQLLLVTGEAGVGKSHLIGEMTREWAGRGGVAYVGDCRQYGDEMPYGLWVMLLRDTFALRDSDSSERQREKVTAQLALLSSSLARHSRLLTDLLSSQPTSAARVVGPQSKEWRDRLHGAVLDLLRAMASKQPLLVVLESLHDIDVGSLALVNDLLRGLRGIPLLICAAYRPREDLLLAEEAIPTTRLVLDELSEADSLYLAQSLLKDAGLAPELAPHLVDQARGNPFYVKEIVSALTGTRNADAALGQGSVIPSSISDMILAQLDPLGEGVKLTLRIAAVVGQAFSFGVLRAAHLLPISRRDLAERLARLERLHVVRLDQFGEDIVYRFCHPIAQRVTYAGLLREDRERFHQQVAGALEQVYSHELQERYELLADHLYRGGVLTKASTYLVLAGEHAATARALREALTHLELAEELLTACGTCRPRCAQGMRLRLLLDRGRVRWGLGQVAEAKRDYEAAVVLASDLADAPSQGEALLLLGDIALFHGRYLDSQSLVCQAAQRLSALEDRGPAARGLLLLSRAYALQGDLGQARQYAEQALALQDRASDHSGVARCKSWLGELGFVTGHGAQGMDLLHRAIELAEKAGDQALVAESKLRLAQLCLRRGRWGQALQLCQEGKALCRTSSALADVANGQRVWAMILTQIGAFEQALDSLDEAMLVFTDMDWRLGLASGYWIAGEALLALGRYEESAEKFHQALTLGRSTHTAEIVILAQLGHSKLAAVERNWPEGERLCTEARARARQAQMTPLVLAARLGLARVHLGRGQWRLARREAAQALEVSYRLRCPYDIFRAAATLGEALVELGQADRADRYFGEAFRMTVQLSETLPEPYAQVFLDRRYVRIVRQYAGQASRHEAEAVRRARTQHSRLDGVRLMADVGDQQSGAIGTDIV